MIVFQNEGLQVTGIVPNLINFIDLISELSKCSIYTFLTQFLIDDTVCNNNVYHAEI